MKLKLADEQGVVVLEVIEPVDSQGLKILRAGINKIFKTGKNRMVLDLSHSGKLDTAVLRDLAGLNLVARELAGNIILCGLSEQDQVAVSNFGKPSPLICLPTRVLALQVFKKVEAEDVDKHAPKKELPAGAEAKPGAAPVPGAKPAAPPAPGAAGKPAVSAGPPVSAEQVPAVVRELRVENAHLKELSTVLEDRVQDFIKVRRNPDHPRAMQEKVELLERRCLELTSSLRDLEAKSGKKAEA